MGTQMVHYNYNKFSVERWTLLAFNDQHLGSIAKVVQLDRVAWSDEHSTIENVILVFLFQYSINIPFIMVSERSHHSCLG